ncbi:MAG: glycosyltransferase family 4 protein [Gammaproteobacteria bacterium]
MPQPDKSTCKNPIRVCFIAPKAYPLFNTDIKSVFGGAEIDLYHIATELAKSPDFDVSFITADYGQAERENIENITVLKSFKLKQNAIFGAIKIWGSLKAANAEIYVIKTASLGVPLLSLFCKLNKRHFIYRTAHQSECDGSYARDNKIIGKLFVSALAKADILFTQNHEDTVNLKNLFQLESIVIPNGHRASEPKQEEKKSILWTGRSADFKHPGRFLELAEQFPAEKFVMICQQATEDTQYETLVSKANSLANVEFIERVPFQEIDKYFRAAKVLVNTSESEGFSNTFIQAFKAATPIVSYNVNPDDFLTKYDCGIFCQGSTEKMKQALQFILENDRYIESGKNGRKLFEEQYDIQNIIELYKEHFRRITEGSSACVE